jgi:arsenite-transporting ATPase
MRIIIFSGKGGCGTSTMAAGTACLLAGAGQRTLAFGLGRGLGDAFNLPLSPAPQPIGERLAALEGHGGLAVHDEFRDWIQGLLDWRGMDADLAEDLASLPGINHIGRLLELEHLLDSGDYDAAVLDAGGLAQFLDLPSALDAAARWLDRLFAPRQSNVFEPFLRAFAGDYATAGEDVFETGRNLLGRLAALRDLLTDPGVTSVRVVVSADPASVVIAREALSVLGLFSYAVDAIVVDQLLPATVKDVFFAARRKEQIAALNTLRKLSPAPPVVEADLQATAPTGVDALATFALSAYGQADPASFFAPSNEHTVASDHEGFVLRVFVPFARREDLRLEEVEDGIAVHLNGRRCVLTLPDTSYGHATAWAYEQGVLSVNLSG